MDSLFSLIQHYALPFVVVISAVVFVHEYGHYWVARLCGIRIESFSIGFGPKLFGWTDKHGTVWQVACLPLGGYVKMYGDADASSRPGEEVKTMTDEEKKVSFHHQNVNKRLAVVSAGPIANYIFAIVVLAALFMAQGQPFSPPVVGALVENGVAARAGFQTGDKILSIDGHNVARFEDIKRMIGMNSGVPVPIVVARAETSLTLTVTPEITVQKDRFGGEHKLGRIGIVSDKVDYKKWPPLQALEKATVEAWTMSVDTLKAVGQIVMGVRGSEEIGGPLRIAEMSGNIAKDGAVSLIWFVAIISLNLGLINLFPIPLLDGGHILFFAFEKFLGRPLSDKTQEVGMRLGLTFVVTLMVLATWNDLVHLDVIEKIKTLLS